MIPSAAGMLVWLLAAIAWIFPIDELPPGPVEESTVKQIPGVIWASFDERVDIIRAETDRIFRVAYPEGTWGSQDCGAQFMLHLQPQSVASCQYAVRFPSDFQFVKGGKLPGLAGGTATSGGERPTGDGWSARLMWRKDGEAVLYLYHLDQQNEYGDDVPLQRRFRRGNWHLITEQVQVNRPGQADGRIRIWFDDELVLDRQDLRLRTGKDAEVDRFFFSTFFGGSGPEWASPSDQFADFKNIKLSTNPQP